MFLHYLPEETHELFLKLASLVAVVDNELERMQEVQRRIGSGGLWGRYSSNIFSSLKEKESLVDKETFLLYRYAVQELSIELDKVEEIHVTVNNAFFDAMKIAFGNIEFDESIEPLKIAFLRILDELTKKYIEEVSSLDGKVLTSQVKKTMLIELAFMVLADGIVSEFEIMLMGTITKAFDFEETDFEELFDSAKSINAEVVKATALILE